MSLKVRAILVIVIGVVMGLSLSIGGGLMSGNQPPDREELAWEQAPLVRAPLLESARRQIALGRRTLHRVVDGVDAGSIRAGSRP